MRFRVSGSGSPVLKLSGLVGGIDLYREEIQAALAAGYKVGELETTGDRWDDPIAAPITWDSLAAEAAQALDELDAGPAVLWGTSFGCLLALAIATRYPGRVRGLLLANPPDPGWKPRLHGATMAWANRRRSPVAWKSSLFQVGFIGLIGWEFLYPSALLRLPRATRALWSARTPPKTIAAKLDLLWDNPPGWPQAGLPTSIVAGRWDTVTPPACARRLGERLGGQVRWIDRGGHSMAFSRGATCRRNALEELHRLFRHDDPTDYEPKG